MIRYIDLTGRITPGGYYFAWFDTVTDKFLSFCDVQVWMSWRDFQGDYFDHCKTAFPDRSDEIGRFQSLFPVDKRIKGVS